MPGPARIAVRVTPRAGRDKIAGYAGGELEVRVTVAPDGGKANAAVCRLVAQALGLPKSAVSVVRGSTSRHKMLAVAGVDVDTVHAAFGAQGEA